MREVQKLRELLERCEKASGPDREIECRLFASLQYGSSYEEMVGIVPNLMQWACPAYTASLDAAIALVERMLPGWVYELYGPSEMSRALALLKPAVSRQLWQARGETMPLAVLCAMLKALISQAEGESSTLRDGLTRAEAHKMEGGSGLSSCPPAEGEGVQHG